MAENEFEKNDTVCTFFKKKFVLLTAFCPAFREGQWKNHHCCLLSLRYETVADDFKYRVRFFTDLERARKILKDFSYFSFFVITKNDGRIFVGRLPAKRLIKSFRSERRRCSGRYEPGSASGKTKECTLV